jgi:hypothetical protein
MPPPSIDWADPALTGVDVIVNFYSIRQDRTVASFTPLIRPGVTPKPGATVVVGDDEGNRARGTIVVISRFQPGVEEIHILLDMKTFTGPGDEPAGKLHDR